MREPARERRDLIFELVKAHPGITADELAKRSDVERPTVWRILKELDVEYRNGPAQQGRGRPMRQWYLKGTGGGIPANGVMRQAFLNLIAERPGITTREAAEILKVDVSWIRRMATSEEAVEHRKQRVGRNTTFHYFPRGAKAAARERAGSLPMRVDKAVREEVQKLKDLMDEHRLQGISIQINQGGEHNISYRRLETVTLEEV